MSEKKINYAYRNFGQFRTTLSCSHQDVDEDFFNEVIRENQYLRKPCEAIGGKNYCEQCDYFGRKAEFYSEQDDSVTVLDNALNKELAE